MNTIKISVIVPVYKVEPYLEKCIDSILNQTYKDFELILVDDGSPDNCPAICDEYAKKDSRITVIHKQNGGLSDARNAALEIAKGEFVTFVDSDDFIAPNALQLLMEAAVENNSDVVISTKFEFFSNGNICKCSENKGSIVVDSKKALELIFYKNGRWDAWGSLYKRGLFEKERFPVGKLYEDIATIPKIILNAENICFIDASIYYYFVRTGSIMDGSKTTVKIDLLEVCMDLVSTMKKKIKDKPCLYNINAGVLMELCSRVDLAEKNYDLNKQFILKSRKYLRQNFKYILFSNQTKLKRKIYYLIISFGFGKVLKKFYCK
ncbi:MAG: glycosyltransferase [Clostridia bacterium]|nr:glycosyltransferase [Clostridia bacterium]